MAAVIELQMGAGHLQMVREAYASSYPATSGGLPTK